MKLKRYLEFINENIIDELDFLTQHKYENDNTLIDVFEYLIDYGYEFTLEDRGLSTKTRDWSFTKNKYVDQIVFSDILLYGDENTHLAYKIDIEPNYKNKKDLTKYFIDACNALKEKAELDVVLTRPSNLGVNFDDVKIEVKDQIYIDGIARDPIYLILSERKPFEISIEEFIKYYNWSDVIVVDNVMYCDIDFYDLVDRVLSENEFNKEYIRSEDGYGELYGVYVDYNYDISDLESDIQYTIDDDNIRLLYEKIREELGEEEFNELLSDFDIEGDPIDYIMTNKPKNFIELFEDCDIVSEVINIIRDMHTNDMVDTYYKNIIAAFDNLIKEELSKDFTKIEKDDKNYYRFKYSNDWILEHDFDYLADGDLEGIFIDYIDNVCSNNKINPVNVDYGSPDVKELNAEIKSILE